MTYSDDTKGKSKFELAVAASKKAKKTNAEFIELWDKVYPLAWDAALEQAGSVIRKQSDAYDTVMESIDELERQRNQLNAREQSLNEFEHQLKIIAEKIDIDK